MATFGTFVYGTGQVYGSQAVLSNMEVLSRRTILAEFSDELLVDEAYLDPANYTVSIVTGTGPIRVLRVLPINTNTALSVILVTDYMTPGTRYQLSLSDLNDRVGNIIGGVGDLDAKDTKVDSILRSIPRHFDHRPESIMATVLTAIGKQDQDIGGARADTYEFGAVLLPGRPPPPEVTIVLATPGVMCPNSPPAGTSSYATRIVMFIDDVPVGDATLDTSTGSWSAAVPTASLTDGVPVDFKVVALGEAGYAEDTETVTPDISAPSSTLTSHSTPTDTDTDPVTFVGTSEVGATVSLLDSNRSVLGTDVADGGGNWSIGPVALGVGAIDLILNASDACGNDVDFATLELTVS